MLFFMLWRNVQKTLNAHGSFTLAASAPPNAITRGQVICNHHSKRRAGKGRQTLSPRLCRKPNLKRVVSTTEKSKVQCLLTLLCS